MSGKPERGSEVTKKAREAGGPPLKTPYKTCLLSSTQDLEACVLGKKVLDIRLRRYSLSMFLPSFLCSAHAEKSCIKDQSTGRMVGALLTCVFTLPCPDHTPLVWLLNHPVYLVQISATALTASGKHLVYTVIYNYCCFAIKSSHI